MNQIIMNMETNMSPAKVPVIVPLAYQAMVCLQEKINQANSMVVRVTKGNSKREEDRIPLWNRYSLSIPEAAKYFGIGETRIYQIVAEHPGAISGGCQRCVQGEISLNDNALSNYNSAMKTRQKYQKLCAFGLFYDRIIFIEGSPFFV